MTAAILFVWFSVWCLLKLLAPQPERSTVITIAVGWACAVLLLAGVIHLPGGHW